MCDGSGNYSVLISHVVSIRTEDSFPLYIQFEKNNYLYLWNCTRIQQRLEKYDWQDEKQDTAGVSVSA